MSQGKGWVLASNNAHKVEEIGRILAPHGISLRPLREFPDVEDGVSERGARFVCALAVVTSAGEEVWRGTCEGSIATAPAGTHGFGYDPLFLPKEIPGKCMAELAPSDKDRIGHRGQALEHLPAALNRLKA